MPCSVVRNVIGKILSSLGTSGLNNFFAPFAFRANSRVVSGEHCSVNRGFTCAILYYQNVDINVDTNKNI